MPFDDPQSLFPQARRQCLDLKHNDDKGNETSKSYECKVWTEGSYKLRLAVPPRT